jgi:hypothetical protein
MITVSMDMGFPFRCVESSIQIRYSFFRVHLRQNGIHGQSFDMISGFVGFKFDDRRSFMEFFFQVVGGGGS